MQVTNTKYYHNLDFEDYLKMEGTSYSSIKGFEGEPTEGMKLGTRVHAYLNEPKEYDWQQADIVVPIATSLRTYLGEAFHHLDKEVAFTSNFNHNGMRLKYKGRADMMKAGRIIVDLKILAGPLPAAIDRFGYTRQISGYCLATGASVGLILAWNKLQKRVEVKAIKPDENFWAFQCVRMGEPMDAATDAR
jgi:hypothetical protein